MGVNVLAHLAVVGRELEGRAPVGGLGVGFGDQEIGVLKGTRKVALDGLRCPIVMILSSVVDVVGGNVERLGDGLLVDVGAHRAAIVGSDELLFKVMLETDEDVGIGGAVAAGLVVELPADDGGVVLVVGHDVAD